MTPKRHPSPDILANYAAGLLEPGFGLVAAAHIETCSQCGAYVRDLEAASGAALNDLAPAALAPDALGRALARISSETEKPEPRDTRPLLERLPLKPKRWVAPGVWAAPVDTPHAPDDRVYLLSVAKGLVTARHEHSGLEYCAVLKGAYRDEFGIFAAGDFAAADTEVNHRPIVYGDEDCVCLFATEGRLKPSGWIGRIAFSLANV